MNTNDDVDFVIVGSGIAGLRATLALGPRARTVVLTKDAISESATQYAQGGIAVALGEDDTVALHEQDTLAAGDGLCSPAAVKTLVEEGPHAIEELLAWGADFDCTGERLERTREAAHSRSRILHAHGDSTGREIAETLLRRVTALPNVRWEPHCLATRLLLAGERVIGIEYRDQRSGHARQIRARAILLGTGGLGRLFADTTNPGVATGDGPALAYAAGAILADMEFVQFHPTALALDGAPQFLLSEALRGEGAVLRNPAGERFMDRYHIAAELAPRDIVARALESELQAAGGRPLACFLDATALPADQLERRFPRIASTLARFGLNLARDWIPIRPAAHYAMGGVWTGLDGRTSIPGLYAAGECAATGVHGANRLASNSLLEGLVFGARAGRTMDGESSNQQDSGSEREVKTGSEFDEVSGTNTIAGDLDRLRSIMSDCAGVIRAGEGLERGRRALTALGASATLPGTTAAAILRAALARQESRGAHYRADFSRAEPALTGLHSFQSRDQAVVFRTLP